MLVLRSLLLNGGQRYNEILRSVPDISPKELTRNLRELEGDCLLTREQTQYAGGAAYVVSELGSMLMPAFLSARSVVLTP